MKNLQDILIEKRKEKGMSQAELAKQLHVTKQTVSKWETGKGMPDISMLTSISEVLDVTVDELLTGREPETRVEIVEREVIKKPSLRKIVAMVAPIVIVLIIAVTLMSIYIPKAINKPTELPAAEPVYIDMDIAGNRAYFEGSFGSDSYTSGEKVAYYRFKAEFTSLYTFEVLAYPMGKVYFNEKYYECPPVVETPNGQRIKIERQKYLTVGEEVRIEIHDGGNAQSVSVKMSDNFQDIIIDPHSEYAIALKDTEYKLVRYIMNPDNWRHSLEALEFDRLLKLKYIDRTGKREYEELWRADNKNETGSRKVFETKLKSFEPYKYEGWLNILILRNNSDERISLEGRWSLNFEYIIEDEIEEIELDKVYEFSFNDDTRFKYYKLRLSHRNEKRYNLCFDRFTYGEIYTQYMMLINRYGWGDYNMDEQIIKNGTLFFAKPYYLHGGKVYADNEPEPDSSYAIYYIKVEKMSGAEKGKFYITETI